MNDSTQTADTGRNPAGLYEFDRERVPKSRLLGARYFAGAYAGEHVAATEFVIGVTFVNWGASVQDIFLGLVVGNLLAVLTWTLVCAPIAVDTRLTLYWYLRKIGGPQLTSIYNVINALLYSIMAGCMITVSASAIRIPFGIPLSALLVSDGLPLRARGPSRRGGGRDVGGLGIPEARDFRHGVLSMDVPDVHRGCHGCSADALRVRERRQLPRHGGPSRLDRQDARRQRAAGILGKSRLSLGSATWACMAHCRTWRCSDSPARHRTASTRRSACSLGHYLAWICAGLMGAGAALLMGRPLVELDAGDVGYQALGWVGALAVVIAGWTTSNPTLYRVGLALQAVTPNWSRAKVTLVAGIATTVVACFPFVFTGLLDYVAIYGLLISPIGAIIVTEHWILSTNRLAPLLGNPQGPFAQLGGTADLGHGGGLGHRPRARRSAAPVLRLPSGLRIRDGCLLAPRQGDGSRARRIARCGCCRRGRSRPGTSIDGCAATDEPLGACIGSGRSLGPCRMPVDRLSRHARARYRPLSGARRTPCAAADSHFDLLRCRHGILHTARAQQGRPSPGVEREYPVGPDYSATLAASLARG